MPLCPSRPFHSCWMILQVMEGSERGNCGRMAPQPEQVRFGLGYCGASVVGSGLCRRAKISRYKYELYYQPHNFLLLSLIEISFFTPSPSPKKARFTVFLALFMVSFLYGRGSIRESNRISLSRTIQSKGEESRS